MREARNYERYAISYAEDQKAKIEVIIEGESVHMVDFSLGGLYFLSEKSFSKGEIVNLSINLENRGKIDLIGKVVRTKQETDSERWGIAIDLSQTYNLKTIHKV
jgi:Tfp pilus assembly protein PilZ